MPYRSPARFLAPLALLAAIVTIYLVVRPETGGSPDSRGSTATLPDQGAAGAAARRTKAAPKAMPKVYTVKSGDVLGSISESTGVAVADLLDYNDIDDAQNLRVGQRLKLTP